jgi:protein TonB
MSLGDQWYPIKPDGTKNEGIVELKVCVSDHDSLESVSVVKSSGYEDLDNAAVGGMKTGRYKSGTKGGHPVAACKNFRITFDAHKKSGEATH